MTRPAVSFRLAMAEQTRRHGPAAPEALERGVACRSGSVTPCARVWGWRIALGHPGPVAPHPPCPLARSPLGKSREAPAPARGRREQAALSARGGPRQLARGPRGRGQSRGLWPGRGGPSCQGDPGAGKAAPARAGGRRRRHHERPEAQLHLRGLRRVGAPGGGARVRAEGPAGGRRGGGGSVLAGWGLRVRAARWR